MSIVFCPGFHSPSLTENFISSLYFIPRNNIFILPTEKYPPYDGLHILQLMIKNIKLTQPVLLISFSAGVVGAISSAYLWQILGGKITALIAIDGWGVPLISNFPIYRLSHDYFTHWSSNLLGSGKSSFYANPPVAHLQMLTNPDNIKGWCIENNDIKINTTVTKYIKLLLQEHGTLN